MKNIRAISRSHPRLKATERSEVTLERKSSRKEKLIRSLKISAVLLAVLSLASSSCRSLRYLTLKTDDMVCCEIVTPPEAGAVAAYAGKELQTFMSQSLGMDVPLVSTPTSGKISIILGQNQLLEGAGINIANLSRDAFMIKSVSNRIFIVGKDCIKTDPAKAMQTHGIWSQFYERGTLFGAYDFLERFLGVRFYFPGEIGTIVPQHATLRIPGNLNIIKAPDKIVRSFPMYGSPGTRYPASWFDNDNAVKDKNLNYVRLRMETKIIPKCHGLAGLGYVERFGKSHPEYFALMANGKRYCDPWLPHPGQLCYSSRIREEIYKDMEAYLTGKPASSRGVITKWGAIWDPSHFQPGYCNIMPQDSFYPCQCPECQKHFSQGDQATSDFIWGMVIETALRLKENEIPGKLVMMSYSPYTLPPTDELPDNVLVFLAVGGPCAHPQMWAEQRQLILDWNRKCGARVALWLSSPSKYGRRFVPAIPPMVPEAMGDFIKQNKDEIEGAYICSDMDEYLYNYLNYYIFGKLMWDSSLDPQALLDEHYRLMFGPAAAPMREVFRRFEFIWKKRIVGDVRETNLGLTFFPPSTYQIWEEIYNPVEIAGFDARFDQAEELAAEDSLALQRVRFMRKHLLNPVKRERNNYLETKQEIADLKIYVRELATEEHIRLDGNPDENAWNDAERIFLRPALKYKDKPCEVKTVVRLLRDKENLYIAFECAEPEMAQISTTTRKFDSQDIWSDSSVEIFLNPSADREQYHQLGLNASGSLTDLSWRKTGGGGVHDYGWNSSARAATSTNVAGWTAEIAVPIVKLEGFNPEGVPANFNRNRIISAKDGDYVQLYSWSPFLVSSFQEVDNFGSLVFDKPADDNIIKNGDFTGKVTGRIFDGWIALRPEDIKHGESWAVVTDNFITGGKALMLNCPALAKISVTQYLPELKPDTEYFLTFFVKTDKINGDGAVVNIWDDKNRWFPENWYTGTISWTKQGFRFKTGPDTNGKSYICLRIMNASGTVWFDDVRLRELGK